MGVEGDRGGVIASNSVYSIGYFRDLKIGPSHFGVVLSTIFSLLFSQLCNQ